MVCINASISEAFGTCPPTNLATPMPIHAGHLINQFVSNVSENILVYFSILRIKSFNDSNC